MQAMITSTRGKRRLASLTVVAAAVAVTIGAMAAASPAGTSTADSLRTIERARLHALVAADTTAAAKLIAPDFQLINPGGGVSGKTDYMTALKKGDIDYR